MASDRLTGGYCPRLTHEGSAIPSRSRPVPWPDFGKIYAAATPLSQTTTGNDDGHRDHTTALPMGQGLPIQQARALSSLSPGWLPLFLLPGVNAVSSLKPNL